MNGLRQVGKLLMVVLFFLAPLSALAQITAPLAGSSGVTATSSGQGSLVTGYGQITSTTATQPAALANFGFTQNGILTTEAGVAASAPTTVARVFVDYSTVNGTDSGVAVVNPSSSMITVNVQLNSAQGVVTSCPNQTIAANGYLAIFAGQLCQGIIPNPFLGTLTLTSATAFAATSLQMGNNSHGEALYNSLPVATPNAPPAGNRLYFSQFADGGGFSTEILLMNLTNAPISGTVSFFDGNGHPVTMNFDPSIGSASALNYSIAGNGMEKYTTTGSVPGTPIQTGFVVVTSTIGTLPSGAVIFSCYNGPGGLASLAGVLNSPLTTNSRMYVEKSNSPLTRNTGVAIVNPNSSTVAVQLNLVSLDGSFTASNTITLPANNYVAAFIDQSAVMGAAATSIPANFKGVLTLSSNLPIAPVTLRLTQNQRGEDLYSTLPVVDLNNPPTGPLYLPQVADGGEYITQIILINTGSSSGTATVNFFNSIGSAVQIPLSTITSVSVSPLTAPVQVGQTRQFTATVQGIGNFNSAVTWAVNGVVGGNATVGTIMTAGLYYAPTTVPNPTTVAITATSQSDTSQAASANVSLSYPAPTIYTIAPNSVSVASADTNLAVFGTGFTPASVVNLGATALATSYVSATEVTATIPASAQTVASTHTVAVSNPTPGGGTSGSASFSINNLVPVLASSTPSSIVVGSATTQIQLMGSDFLPTSTVSLNSTTIAASYVSATQIVATVPASSLAVAGNLALTVENPMPGGGTSNGLALAVTAAGENQDLDFPTKEQAPATGSEALTYIIGSIPSSSQQASPQLGKTFDLVTDGISSLSSLLALPNHVPWMSQVPPGVGDTCLDWNNTGNCGIASLLMAAGYYSNVSTYNQQTAETLTTNLLTTQYNNTCLMTSGWFSCLGPIKYVPDATACPSSPPSLKSDQAYYGPEHGFSIDALALIAKNVYGFQNLPSRPGVAPSDISYADLLKHLREQLQQGHPVIVHVFYEMRLPPNCPADRDNGSCGGHYMLLVGLDDNDSDTGLMYFNDPGRSWYHQGQAENVSYSKSAFKLCWNHPHNRCEYLPIIKGNEVPPPSIVQKTLDLPNATVGTSYSTTFGVNYGVPPYTWSFQGSLPAGISLDQNHGTLSGAPQGIGTFAFTVKVTDSNNSAAIGSTSLTVGSLTVPPSILTPAQLLGGVVGQPYSVVLSAAGGTAPYHWSAGTSTCPTSIAGIAGLCVSGGGSIQGTPTNATPGASFTLLVTDSSTPPQLAGKSMNLTILPANLPPNVYSVIAAPATVNVKGTSVLTCTAADPEQKPLTYVWSLTGGSPLTGNTSTLTWTAPSTTGTYTATCTVTDDGGLHASGSTRMSATNSMLSSSVFPSTGTAGVTQFTVTGSGATLGGGVTATITLPNGSTTTSGTTANSSGQYTFGPFTETQAGVYSEVDSDNATGGKSNAITWAVTASSTTTAVTGRVVWNGVALPNAGVQLKQVGDYYSLPALASTVSAADGTFTIQNPPTGNLMIYALAPSSDYNDWAGRSVTVVSGQQTNVGDLSLYKKLQLISPGDGSVVTTTTPTLQWTAFPGTTRYDVYVFNNATFQRVFLQSTQGTQITVSPALQRGQQYQWSVDAYNSSGQEIAYWSAWVFTISAGEMAAEKLEAVATFRLEGFQCAGSADGSTERK
jgi:hypothetical protein